MESEKTSRQWPVRGLALFYLISFILACFQLPSLDGTPGNNFRWGMYAALSIIFWIRIHGAIRRKETGRKYIPYAIMMIAGQLLIWPLHDWIIG